MLKKIAILLILALSMSFIAKAQETFNVEDVLPSKTFLFGTNPNCKKYCEEMQTSGLYQMFTSKEWEPFLQTLSPEVLQMMKQQRSMIEQQLEISLDDLLGMFTKSGQIGIAVVDVKMSEQMPQPMPIILVSWNLAEVKDQFVSFFDKTRQKVYGMAPVKIEETKYQSNGYDVTIINTPVPVFFTYVGTTLLICSDKDYLESVLANTQKREDCLSNCSQYQTVKANALKDRAGELLYVNTKSIRDFAMKMVNPQQVQPMMQMWGLDTLDAIALGVSYKNKQVVESIYLYTPQGRTGLLAEMLPSCEADQKLVQFMPNKLFGFSHGFIDFVKHYDSTFKMVQMFSPEFTPMLEEIKKAVEAKLGIDLKETLSTIGNEYLFTISCSGGLIPDVALQFSLKDMAKFQETFQKLLVLIPEKYRYQVAWNGHNFVYFNFSTKREPIPVAPAVAIEDNRVLIAMYPETLKNLINQKNGQFPVDFVACMDPSVKYIYNEYWDLKSLAVPIYKTAIPLIQSMTPREKLPVEPALLPGSELLEKYMTNLFFMAVHNDKGVLWEMYSPTGVIPAVVVGGSALYGVQQKFGKRHYNRKPLIEKPAEENN